APGTPARPGPQWWSLPRRGRNPSPQPPRAPGTSHTAAAPARYHAPAGTSPPHPSPPAHRHSHTPTVPTSPASPAPPAPPGRAAPQTATASTSASPQPLTLSLPLLQLQVHPLQRPPRLRHLPPQRRNLLHQPPIIRLRRLRILRRLHHPRQQRPDTLI